MTSTTSIDSNSILSFENSEDFSLDSLFLDQDSSCNESPNHNHHQTPEFIHPESNFVSENPLQEMIPFADWTSTNPWGHQGCGKKKI